MSDDFDAPGWDALSDACEALYPGQEPKHYATAIKYALGGPDPLDGISVYRAEDPVPHWHYVTYGFSELYAKELDDPDVSGYGFELTLRLTRAPEDEEPPVFALNFLQNLARYVFQSGNVFEPGEHMDFNGPIEARSDTAITAGCFILDPELGEIDTPHGSVQFVQVVGITADELAAIKAWNTPSFLRLLSRIHRNWVTDTKRRSILEDRALADAVRAGAAADGSSTGLLYSRSLEVETEGAGWRIRVGALDMRTILAVLPGRLPHGRDLVLRSPDATLVFSPAQACDLTVDEHGAFHLALSRDACADLINGLRAERGEYGLPQLAAMAIEVVPTEIRDQAGNVVDVVG